MVNIYQCDNCGNEWEIDPDHEDTNNCTVAGIFYKDECERCTNPNG